MDDQRRIVSTGYNGFPRGVEDWPSRLDNRDVKYEMIVHGEINAILFANQSVHGCTLYTWPFMPCSRCAAIVIQSGIRTVVSPYNDNPRWQISFQLTEQMFRESGVRLSVTGGPDVR